MVTLNPLLVIMSWLVVLCFPQLSQAVNITVEINGQVCATCTGSDTVMIPDGTYNGVTIQGLSGANQAKVFAGVSNGNPDDTNVDILTLDNAKITGAQPNTEYKITFWGAFTPGPTTPPNYWYKITGQNNRFQTPAGGAAVNSWVQAKGFIEHPAGSNAWQTITSGALQQTITNLNYSKVFSPYHTLSQEFTSVTNNRTLKGELKFKFYQTSHELRLTNGVRIYSSGTPGPGGQCDDCTLCEEAGNGIMRPLPWWRVVPPFNWFFGE